MLAEEGDAEAQSLLDGVAPEYLDDPEAALRYSCWETCRPVLPLTGRRRLQNTI